MQDIQLNYIEENFNFWLSHLSSLVALPSISTISPIDMESFNSCAIYCKELLLASGLTNAKLINNKSAPPYVFAEKFISSELPTILLYAHYDIQPSMGENKWLTPPFQTLIKDNRIYGRGCADDKGAVILHAATIASFLLTGNPLPVNIKVLFEGEEEAGSPNLAAFLKNNKESIKADCVVIPDLCNLNFKNPSLTTSLRGIVQANITIKTAKTPLHSGLFGNIAPDPVQKLSALINKVTERSKGSLLSLIDEKSSQISKEQYNTIERLKDSKESILSTLGLLDGIDIKKSARELLEDNWRKSSLNITAFSAGKINKPANIILPDARACFSIRIPPGIAEAEVKQLLEYVTTDDAHNNYDVTIDYTPSAPSWEADTNSVFFDKMKSALSNSFNHPVDIIGSGATIPIASIFQDQFPEADVILTGIEDPLSKAHAENESLDLKLLKKLMCSQVHFLQELKN